MYTMQLCQVDTRSLWHTKHAYFGQLGFPFVCSKDYLQPAGTEKSCSAFIYQRTVGLFVNRRNILKIWVRQMKIFYDLLFKESDVRLNSHNDNLTFFVIETFI